MVGTAIGIQPINFTNREGQQIVGTNLFVGYADENVRGLRAEKFFIRETIDLPKDIKPNDKLNLSFNSKGKVEEVTKVG